MNKITAYGIQLILRLCRGATSGDLVTVFNFPYGMNWHARNSDYSLSFLLGNTINVRVKRSA
jgi:hypothetical protein